VTKGQWGHKANKASKVFKAILAHNVYEVLPDN